MPTETKAAWFAFLAEHCEWPQEDIEAAVIRLTEAEPPEPARQPRRRRRAAA